MTKFPNCIRNKHEDCGGEIARLGSEGEYYDICSCRCHLE